MSVCGCDSLRGEGLCSACVEMLRQQLQRQKDINLELVEVGEVRAAIEWGPTDTLEKFANTPFCRECGFEQCQCSKFAKLTIEDKTDAMPCWGALKRLHEIAATSDEETGPALTEIADSIHEYISKTKPPAPARDGVREAATEEAIRKVYDKWSGWIPYGHGPMLMADLRELAAKEQADGQ